MSVTLLSSTEHQPILIGAAVAPTGTLNQVSWDFGQGIQATVKIQATHAATPTASDWSDIYVIGIYAPVSSQPVTAQHGNATLHGNYTWVRVNITGWTGGTINSISVS
jgi:hypothetical protein